MSAVYMEPVASASPERLTGQLREDGEGVTWAVVVGALVRVGAGLAA
jgi:hypothetical protein